MAPAEMEKQINAVSWPTLLSDSPPRRDVGFRVKEEDARFPLGFEIGFREGEFRAFKGALSGSNLELFLHELTRSVDNVATFDQLPIPFRAIATDMVTGREVVFDRGPIYQAMRASMSVPGMFSPAEIDGRILGDGGLVNNLPVDVVRAMGADIVIAVNIGTPLMSRDQLSSVLGYTAQMVNILTEQNVRAQLALLRPGDILISPDLGDLTFVDFGKSAQFIALGEKAAEGMRERLATLSESATTYVTFQSSLLVPVETSPKTLDFVRIEGTHFANPKVLEDQMQTQPGEPFSLSVLEKDLSRLYGRGDFEQIDYHLMQEQNRQGLVVDVTEKSWGPNYLRFGLALNSDLQGDTAFNFLVGHKRTWINSLGAEWINEVTLGTVNRYATEFYQPLTLGNFLFASAHGLIERASGVRLPGQPAPRGIQRAHGNGGARLRHASVDAGRNQAGLPVDAPAGQSDHRGARVSFRGVGRVGRPLAAALGRARQSVLSAQGVEGPRRGVRRQQPPERAGRRRLHQHRTARNALRQRRHVGHAG